MAPPPETARFWDPTSKVCYISSGLTFRVGYSPSGPVPSLPTDSWTSQWHSTAPRFSRTPNFLNCHFLNIFWIHQTFKIFLTHHILKISHTFQTCKCFQILPTCKTCQSPGVQFLPNQTFRCHYCRGSYLYPSGSCHRWVHASLLIPCLQWFNGRLHGYLSPAQLSCCRPAPLPPGFSPAPLSPVSNPALLSPDISRILLSPVTSPGLLLPSSAQSLSHWLQDLV